MIVSIERVPVLSLGEKIEHLGETYIVSGINQKNDKVKLTNKEHKNITVSYRLLTARKLILPTKRNKLQK